MTPTPPNQYKPDPCWSKLCELCGSRIQAGSFHCPKCNICICFTCGIQLLFKEDYPANCPKCGTKLGDSLFRLIDVTRKILDDPDPRHGR